MEDYEFILIIIGIVVVFQVIYWIIWSIVWIVKIVFRFIRNIIYDPQKYKKLEKALYEDVLETKKEMASQLKKYQFGLKKDFLKQRAKLVEKEKRLDMEFEIKKRTLKKDMEKIMKQKTMGFPWVARAYADYFTIKDDKLAEYLENKKHPAYTAAKHVRRTKREKRELIKENKILSYKINYFETLFPWLTELIAENEDDDIPVSMFNNQDNENQNDKIRKYLTPEEYSKLPSIERNQKALDRYVESRMKSKWAIGRDYEMYIGYLYEQKGYKIEYSGIIDGFDDLGRDIIATKGDEVCIVQCKRWAKWKKMREKHIFQLFGTTMEYWIKNFCNNTRPRTFEEFAKFLNESKIRPIFVTSTKLSDRAKEMAAVLSVEIIENEPLGRFPRIKCNINSDEFGRKTKIYHLPMDQQYDRTIIGNQPGEFYAFTVKEAESAGFRRAFRHIF